MNRLHMPVLGRAYMIVCSTTTVGGAKRKRPNQLEKAFFFRGGG